MKRTGLISLLVGTSLISATAFAEPTPIEQKSKMPSPPEEKPYKTEVIPLSQNNNFFSHINSEDSLERKFRMDYYGENGKFESVFAYFICDGKKDKIPAAAFFFGKNHVAYFDTGVKGIPDGYFDHVDFDFDRLYSPELNRFNCISESDEKPKEELASLE